MYILYNGQEILDSQIPPSINFYLDRFFGKNNIKALNIKKEVPDLHYSIPRKTSTREEVHYLLDIWRPDGETFHKREVFKNIWTDLDALHLQKQYKCDGFTDFNRNLFPFPEVNDNVSLSAFSSPSYSPRPISPSYLESPKYVPSTWEDPPSLSLPPASPVYLATSSPTLSNVSSELNPLYSPISEVDDFDNLDTDPEIPATPPPIPETPPPPPPPLPPSSPPPTTSRSIPSPPPDSFFQDYYSEYLSLGTCSERCFNGHCGCHGAKKKLKFMLKKSFRRHPPAIYEENVSWPVGIRRIK